MDRTLRCEGKPHYLSGYSVAGEEVVNSNSRVWAVMSDKALWTVLTFLARLKPVRSESHLADPASTLLRFYAPHS